MALAGSGGVLLAPAATEEGRTSRPLFLRGGSRHGGLVLLRFCLALALLLVAFGPGDGDGGGDAHLALPRDASRDDALPPSTSAVARNLRARGGGGGAERTVVENATDDDGDERAANAEIVQGEGGPVVAVLQRVRTHAEAVAVRTEKRLGYKGCAIAGVTLALLAAASATWKLAHPLSFDALLFAGTKIGDVFFDAVSALTFFKSGYPIFGAYAVLLIFISSTASFLVTRHFAGEHEVMTNWCCIVLHWTQLVHVVNALRTIIYHAPPGLQFVHVFVELMLESAPQAGLQSYTAILGVGSKTSVFGIDGAVVLQLSTLMSLTLLTNQVATLNSKPYTRAPMSPLLFIRTWADIALRIIGFAVFGNAVRPLTDGKHAFNLALWFFIAFSFACCCMIVRRHSVSPYCDAPGCFGWALICSVCMPPHCLRELQPVVPSLYMSRVVDLVAMAVFAYYLNGVDGLHHVVSRSLLFSIVLITCLPIYLIDSAYRSSEMRMAISGIFAFCAFLLLLGLGSVYPIVLILLFLGVALAADLLAILYFMCQKDNVGLCFSATVGLVVILAALFGIVESKQLDLSARIVCVLEFLKFLIPAVAAGSFICALGYKLFLSSSTDNTYQLLEAADQDILDDVDTDGKAGSQSKVPAIFGVVVDSQVEFFDLLSRYTPMSSERHPETHEVAFTWARSQGHSAAVARFVASFEQLTSDVSKVADSQKDRLLRSYVVAGIFTAMEQDAADALWHRAVHSFYTNTTLPLLYLRADGASPTWPTAKMIDGETPLISILKQTVTTKVVLPVRGERFIRELISKGADPNVPMSDGAKVLPWMLQAFVEARGPPQKENMTKLVSLLLEARADANEAVKGESPVLWLAGRALKIKGPVLKVNYYAREVGAVGQTLRAIGGFMNFLANPRSLLQPSAENRERRVDVTDGPTNVPLILLKSLLAGRADANAAVARTGATALHLACGRLRTDLAQAMIDAGCTTRTKALVKVATKVEKDSKGSTANKGRSSAAGKSKKDPTEGRNAAGDKSTAAVDKSSKASGGSWFSAFRKSKAAAPDDEAAAVAPEIPDVTVTAPGSSDASPTCEAGMEELSLSPHEILDRHVERASDESERELVQRMQSILYGNG
eukprot:TRINITY_DN46468_c0_g1_i2.p1 TRINITY_DN46468_c0_g1~~TRINITY_DN46468_c0_g1_i2.p1  ORF type:complete len:1131 (-),score=163.26 TRINITY_DN46468_c0_g1_i2:124-3492(-)